MPKLPGKFYKVIDVIKKNYKPEKIILYGSYAYGRPKPWSDIDLLIIKNTKKRPVDRVGDVLGVVYSRKYFSEFAGLKIEPIIRTPIEYRKSLDEGNFFVDEIAQKGKILYERRTRVSKKNN